MIIEARSIIGAALIGVGATLLIDLTHTIFGLGLYLWARLLSPALFQY